jgi:hypothetical protein
MPLAPRKTVRDGIGGSAKSTQDTEKHNIYKPSHNDQQIIVAMQHNIGRYFLTETLVWWLCASRPGSDGSGICN